MTEHGGQVTGAQSLVTSLEAAGVTDIFGIPGGAILPAYDPLMDSTRIRHVLVRHEQGAGHAAQAQAREKDGHGDSELHRESQIPLSSHGSGDERRNGRPESSTDLHT